jgi:hypothetical protein
MPITNIIFSINVKLYHLFGFDTGEQEFNKKTVCEERCAKYKCLVACEEVLGK